MTKQTDEELAKAIMDAQPGKWKEDELLLLPRRDLRAVFNIALGLHKPRGRRRRDLTGNKYGRWTVLGFDHSQDGRSFYLCQCECGNKGVVRQSNLTQGISRSCGCLRKETMEINRKRHGG